MSDPDRTKPNHRPSREPARPAAAPQQPAGSARGERGAAGRVVHDSRGNAVWHWVKETGRIAIESTSRLLKRLEMPGLKTEEKSDQDLRLESDRDAGGGYDPYNQSQRGRRR